MTVIISLFFLIEKHKAFSKDLSFWLLIRKKQNESQQNKYHQEACRKQLQPCWSQTVVLFPAVLSCKSSSGLVSSSRALQVWPLGYCKTYTRDPVTGEKIPLLQLKIQPMLWTLRGDLCKVHLWTCASLQAPFFSCGLTWSYPPFRKERPLRNLSGLSMSKLPLYCLIQQPSTVKCVPCMAQSVVPFTAPFPYLQPSLQQHIQLPLCKPCPNESPAQLPRQTKHSQSHPSMIHTFVVARINIPWQDCDQLELEQNHTSQRKVMLQTTQPLPVIGCK